MTTSDANVFANETLAFDFAASRSDQVSRRAIEMLLASAKLSFVRRAGESEAEWQSRLPAAPFDLLTYARLLDEMFKNRHVLQAVLAGKPLEDVSGWAF